MPPRDPQAIQSDFPELVADLIDQLQLVGTVGLLNFLPEVRPTFLIGSRGLTVVAEEVLFLQSEVFSGSTGNPAASAIIIDTGQLVAGDYDIQIYSSLATTVMAAGDLQVQHRDAADAVNLARWDLTHLGAHLGNAAFRFAMPIATNERIRAQMGVACTGQVSCTIMAHRRIVP